MRVRFGTHLLFLLLEFLLNRVTLNVQTGWQAMLLTHHSRVINITFGEIYILLSSCLLCYGQTIFISAGL